MNRKMIYPTTKGYWVYAHTTPDGMQYIGMSKLQPCQRWFTSSYKETALEPYIEQYGWDNIEHKVLIDNLTKEQAEQWEDRLITTLRMNGFCINERRSGGYARDNQKEYSKAWYKDNRDRILEQQKEYREAHKEEIREQKKEYNKTYREANREQLLEYQKTYNKQRISTPEGKIYDRVHAYNRYHPDLAIETPMEARTKYLETGYIPSYIKHDDLIETK